MARAPKLKVYRTPIGFHDAYVAAPSQKAALEAWGSHHDLFARGVAEIVTDPALTAEPLARPGEVVKRSRGTAAEQVAALPKTKVKPQPKAVAAAVLAARAKPRPPRPKQSALDAAEHSLEAATTEFAEAHRTLQERERALARERRDLERREADTIDRLTEKRDAADRAYRRALEQWEG